MNEKKATPNDEAAPKKLHPESTAMGAGIDAAAQRARALAAMRTGPKSTIELRRHWDIMSPAARVLDAVRNGPKSTIELRRHWDILSPAARVLELRKRGFDILTNWVQQATDCGRLHRVALYVLIRETGGQP